MAEETKPQKLEFEPINDQVLIKVHTMAASALAPDHLKEAEKLPSGEVIAVGRGVFVNGTFVESQLKPGDTVMFDLSQPQPIVRVDLTGKDEDFFAVMSEAMILGKIHNLTPKSHWFNKKTWGSR